MYAKNPELPTGKTAYRQDRLQLAAALTTILLWATAYVGIRFAVRQYSPQALALFRFGVASIFLCAYAGLRKMRMPAFKDIPFILLNGFIGFFLYNWFLNMGAQSVTAAMSSFLVSTAPIFTMAFSIFFLEEKVNFGDWAGIVTGFAGIAIITLGEGDSSMNMGVVWVIAAAILISLYNISIKRLLDRYKPIEATAYCIWAGTLFMLLFTPELIRQLPDASIHTNLVVVYLGIFPAAAGYLLWSYALSSSRNTGHVASFMYLTPVLATLIGWAAIGELPELLSVLGGLIVVSGIVIINRSGRKKL